MEAASVLLKSCFQGSFFAGTEAGNPSGKSCLGFGDGVRDPSTSSPGLSPCLQPAAAGHCSTGDASLTPPHPCLHRTQAQGEPHSPTPLSPQRGDADRTNLLEPPLHRPDPQPRRSSQAAGHGARLPEGSPSPPPRPVPGLPRAPGRLLSVRGARPPAPQPPGLTARPRSEARRGLGAQPRRPPAGRARGSGAEPPGAGPVAAGRARPALTCVSAAMAPLCPGRRRHFRGGRRTRCEAGGALPWGRRCEASRTQPSGAERRRVGPKGTEGSRTQPKGSERSRRDPNAAESNRTHPNPAAERLRTSPSPPEGLRTPPLPPQPPQAAAEAQAGSKSLY